MGNFIIHSTSMAQPRHNMWFQSITQRFGSLRSNAHVYTANGKQVSLRTHGTTKCRKAGDRTVQYIYMYIMNIHAVFHVTKSFKFLGMLN